MNTPALMTQTKLFFGFNNAEGTEQVVTNSAFQSFLESQVVPRFLGFTVYEAVGCWRGKMEKSGVVEILWSTGSKVDQERIEAIREAYRSIFNQTSVLRVDDTVGVSF